MKKTFCSAIQSVCKTQNRPIPNVDPRTGIHFGVIPARAIDPFALDDIMYHGENLIEKEILKEGRKICYKALKKVLKSVVHLRKPGEDIEQIFSRMRSSSKNPFRLLAEYLIDLPATTKPLKHGKNEWLESESFGYAAKEITYAKIVDIIEHYLRMTWETQKNFRNINIRTSVNKFLKDLVEDIINGEAGTMLEDVHGPILYKREGIELELYEDGDIFVLKSPYYTRCEECSPCAPCAGYLLSPREDGLKTYCLPADWFEDGKAPYPVLKAEKENHD